MTTNHIFFIPAIFFIGIFIGSIITSFLDTKKRLHSKPAPTFRIKGRFLAVTFVFFALMFVSTHLFSFWGGAKVLHSALGHRSLFDQQPSATANEVYDRLDSFGEVGREVYQRFTYTADFIFPISFLIFLLSLTVFVGERTTLSPKVRRIFFSLPLLWFASDMAENTLIYNLISKFPVRMEFLAELLGLVTQIKFILLLVSIILPTIVFVFFRQKEKSI